MLTKDSVIAIYYVIFDFCPLCQTNVTPDSSKLSCVISYIVGGRPAHNSAKDKRLTIFFVLCKRETLHSESMPNRWYKNFFEPKL